MHDFDDSSVVKQLVGWDTTCVFNNANSSVAQAGGCSIIVGAFSYGIIGAYLHEILPKCNGILCCISSLSILMHRHMGG